MIAATLAAIIIAADPVDLGTADHDLLVTLTAHAARTAALTRQIADAITAETTAQTIFRTQVIFLAQVAAFAACFIAGGVSWRLFVLAKNQRSFW